LPISGGCRRDRGFDARLSELTDADITILGAGPVGSALALLLARTSPDPSRIVLCHAWRGTRPVPSSEDADAEPATATPSDVATPARPGGGPDTRSLALNHGSRVLL